MYIAVTSAYACTCCFVVNLVPDKQDMLEPVETLEVCVRTLHRNRRKPPTNDFRGYISFRAICMRSAQVLNVHPDIVVGLARTAVCIVIHYDFSWQIFR